MQRKGFFRLLKNEINILRNFLYHRIYISSKQEKNIVDEFHKLYYESHIFGKTWGDTFWLGIPTQKCPLDLWIYQEIIFEVKPDIIIECGTAKGGSALFLASMCDLVKRGRVITIDIEDIEGRPKHERITYLLGSSTSPQTVEQVKNMIESGVNIMVILDSDHSKHHVLNEMRIYGEFVTKGSYLIVEDTNINHPVPSELELGPMEAVEEFLRENECFVVDRSKEKFFMTFNPSGYLIKVK